MENPSKKSENHTYRTENDAKQEFCWNCFLIITALFAVLLLFCFCNNKKTDDSETQIEQTKWESYHEIDAPLPPFVIIKNDITKEDIEELFNAHEFGPYHTLTKARLYPNFFSLEHGYKDDNEKIFFSSSTNVLNVNVITNNSGIYETTSFHVLGNTVVSVFVTKTIFKYFENTKTTTVVIITKEKNKFFTTFLQGYSSGNGRFMNHDLYDASNSEYVKELQGVRSEKEFTQKIK